MAVRAVNAGLSETKRAEEEILQQIREEVANFPGDVQTDRKLLETRTEALIDRHFAGQYLSLTRRAELVRRIQSALYGFGFLDELLSDDTVSEVMINGPDEVFLERAGCLERYAQPQWGERSLEDLIQRIVSMAGREVNESRPIVDTRLPDGSRVNVVLPPVALDGAKVTIRKFPKEGMTMARLIALGSLPPETAAQLRRWVRAKYNIFISGGTGSGKTSFLNALSDFIPKEERIITIEDSAELQIRGIQNLVRMETRNANAAGEGHISIRELIRTSLRMRPERIIVGEVRGPEALDMLQAMNTGHDGSLSTGHANSPQDMLLRLETMVLQGSARIPLIAIRQQIASAIDLIIHLARLRDKTRRTVEIAEVCGVEDGEIRLYPLYRFVEDDQSTLRSVSGALQSTGETLHNRRKLRLAGLEDGPADSVEMAE